MIEKNFSMLNIAICDDEVAVCAQIEGILLNYNRQKGSNLQVECFYSGEELCNSLRNKEKFDLIFLDIEMKDLTGIEVGKKIRGEFNDELTQIVFISGKTNYAMELFQVRPLHFLIKPFSETDIYNVTSKAWELRNIFDEVFVYKEGHTLQKKAIKEIIYFESAGRKIKMVTTNDIIEFYGTLKEIFCQLEKSKFLLVHNSFLVNYNHILNSQYDELTMSCGTHIPISQANRKKVRHTQLEYEKENL